MSIGENVKSFRKQAKLTQLELSKLAKMSRSYLADIEADRYNPSVDTLKTIAEALNIKTHVLLGETEQAESAIPAWATSKDKRDFKKMLQDEGELMFDGVPMDEDDKEKILRVVEAVFWDAKKKNKRKPLDK